MFYLPAVVQRKIQDDDVLSNYIYISIPDLKKSNIFMRKIDNNLLKLVK